MKNTENIKIDELLPELQALREANEELQARNDFLQKCVKALKLNNAKTTLERNKFCNRCNELSHELQDIKQLNMFEFGNLYCSSESLEADGHAFARSLGVGMTREEIEIEKAENAYVPYTAEDF